MSFEQTVYLLLVIGLAIIIYAQKKYIDTLKSRIEQLTNTQNSNASQDERLVYLREQYPELILIEANELWKQK